MLQRLFLLLLLIQNFYGAVAKSSCDAEPPPSWCADEVGVKLKICDQRFADRIAEKYGFTNLGQVGSLKCHFSFRHHSNWRFFKRRRRRAAGTLLDDHPHVEWTEGFRNHIRVKRDDESHNKILPENEYNVTELQLPWPDPMYKNQWFLHAGAAGGWDMWVREAWRLGVSGRGISVSILDDGIQPDHPDLARNFDPDASWDVNGGDPDPTPTDNNDNKHGTRCAGTVAAVAGNDWCGVGIAFNAKIGGVRMLDGVVNDRVEAASLSHNHLHIDVYSASWGPADNGRTFDGPGRLTRAAMLQGITEGRAEKGNIFVWATGNGGGLRDSCSCDGYTTSVYTVSISSATFNNGRPWYLEECPSTLAATYSSGNPMLHPAITTTDMPNSCTKYHTGTSASAPMASAIIALALEANEDLTWRDVQHLVVRTSNSSALGHNPGWSLNGVGRKVGNKFGYGMMNAEAMVKLAKLWQPVPPKRICRQAMVEERTLNGSFRHVFLLDSDACGATEDEVRYLEHVQVAVGVDLSVRGSLQLILISPMGTRSVLLPRRQNDHSTAPIDNKHWPFMSVQQWGEDPRGRWILVAENKGFGLEHGDFHGWTLILHGTMEPAQKDDPEHGEEPLPSVSFATPCSPDEYWTEDKRCVTECPHSFRKDDSDPSERKCSPVCSSETCEVCASASECKRCKSGLLLAPSGLCVSKCPKRTFFDPKKHSCVNCPKFCVYCWSASRCRKCEWGKVWSFQEGVCSSIVQENDIPIRHRSPKYPKSRGDVRRMVDFLIPVAVGVGVVVSCALVAVLVIFVKRKLRKRKSGHVGTMSYSASSQTVASTLSSSQSDTQLQNSAEPELRS